MLNRPMTWQIDLGATFDGFVRAHAKPVLAYCLRRSAHADAHDAAAETFSIAWRRFDQVPEGEAALYWLFGVARKVLANQYRSQQRRRRLASRFGGMATSAEPSAETITLRNQRDQEVVDALARLNEADREVLALIVWDEVPRETAADMLNISVEAVHKRFQRALRRMERELKRLNGHGSTTPPIIEEGGAT